MYWAKTTNLIDASSHKLSMGSQAVDPGSVQCFGQFDQSHPRNGKCISIRSRWPRKLPHIFLIATAKGCFTCATVAQWSNTVLCFFVLIEKYWPKSKVSSSINWFSYIGQWTRHILSPQTEYTEDKVGPTAKHKPGSSLIYTLPWRKKEEEKRKKKERKKEEKKKKRRGRRGGGGGGGRVYKEEEKTACGDYMGFGLHGEC